MNTKHWVPPKSAPKIRDAPDGSHRRGDLHTATNALGHVTTVQFEDTHPTIIAGCGTGIPS